MHTVVSFIVDMFHPSYMISLAAIRPWARLRSEEDREVHNLKVRGSKPRVATSIL